MQSAAELFAQKGWEATTTRDIAEQAGIAVGTLFNYFPTKEALAVAMAGARLSLARQDYQSRLRGDESLDEELFAFVWAGLRAMVPAREYFGLALPAVLPQSVRQDCAGSPLARAHLDQINSIVGRHGFSTLTAVQAQLYWSLYRGVLAHWADDRSPNQEETVALLDQSLLLWIAALRRRSSDAETAGPRA
ncbi:MAG TPA: helix-turn-helix domain-containing protein [Terriglobales bacterium]|nr:helix-turn-helix domain-containing protein [Terriglobales bacterium]